MSRTGAKAVPGRAAIEGTPSHSIRLQVAPISFRNRSMKSAHLRISSGLESMDLKRMRALVRSRRFFIRGPVWAESVPEEVMTDNEFLSHPKVPWQGLSELMSQALCDTEYSLCPSVPLCLCACLYHDFEDLTSTTPRRTTAVARITLQSILSLRISQPRATAITG